MNSFLHRLTRDMAAEALGELPDQQLIDQFLASRGEAAFEVLVRRHGPMVYRVCCQILQHHQDAEDAFQATFLVLAQRLGTVRKHASLASWLHGVAHRVALKAKVQAAARRRHERQPAPSHSLPGDPVSWDETLALLDAELTGLPEKWRLPLVLCYLEGRTQDEAARQVGCSKKTLRRRLEEGRSVLGRRLSRRGVLWPGALWAVLFSDRVSSAALVPRLVRSTVEAACVAAGQRALGLVSAQAAALTQGVLRAMVLSQFLKTGVAVAFAVVVGCAGLLACHGLAGESAPARKDAAAEQKREINRLIRQLGSDRFAEREAASMRLEAIGEPALGALRRAAADSTDAEVRRRAQEALRVIQRRLFGELRRFEGHKPKWVIGVAFSPDGRKALSGGFDGAMRLWSVTSGKEFRTFEGHRDQVLSVAFAPDGRQALSAGRDGTVRLWDLGTGKELRKFTGHAGQVRCVVFSSDGRRAVSSGGDKTIRLWDVARGKELRCLKGHEAEPMTVALSRDGRRILSASFDGTMRLWDAGSGKELRLFRWGTPIVYGVAFSPDGRRALSASQDSAVRLWDLEGGKELRRFEGHHEQVFGVAFSPDGRRALSGGGDTTVRLWDVATGRQLYCYEGHTDGVFQVAFAPDGRRALSCSKDGTVRLWRLPK
jgi:RNA polymerase sigma factor (sigma-70 family)